MMIPLFDSQLQHQRLAPELMPLVHEICTGGRFILGPHVEQFETSFAEYCQAAHCVALNSGTSALHLALRCLEIGAGDEVITTPMTFIATLWAMEYVGARSVLVDIDPRRRTIDPDQIERAITPRTRAIVPVHLYGQPAEMDAILEIAARHGLAVIEDAAQAHGARHAGRRVGGLGAIGCFSFYPTKNLGACGEGGALVTNDARLAARARALRDHGQQRRWRHETQGYNYRMDALQGAVLQVKLRYLDRWNAARRRRAARYRERLSGVETLDLPQIFQDSESVEHLLVVESPQRERLLQRLSAAGIGAGLHYPVPVHLQPAMTHLGYAPGDFPIAERLAERCLSLPMFPELDPQAVDLVCDVLLAECEAMAR
ncbi:MAG TPA: DegT/DnrJ/EryC1/StrS family aminotransferase [Pirellulales bacterium]|nr:DegT/DnrJ/EryC1/StrS family aminotransferase [Pirellulales bacterium]